MTLPNGSNNPPISLNDINNEFNLGRNFGAYLSQRWFKDDNSRGYFPASNISMSDFYSKRKLSPVTSGSATYYYNSSNNPRSIPFPVFNNLTVTVASGQGGSAGEDGGNSAGGPGGTGLATSFGNYVSTSTSSPVAYGSTATVSTNTYSFAISDANQASILALYGVGVSSNIGAPGAAGSPGTYRELSCATSGNVTICVYNTYNKNSGTAGAPGYVTLSWN